MDSVKPITCDQLSTATQIYIEAFSEDPLWKYIFPHDRPQVLMKIFTIFVKYAWDQGIIVGCGDPLQGLATWIPLKNGHLSNLAYLRTGKFQLFYPPFFRAIIKYRNLFRTVENAHVKYTPFPHEYLYLLGVLPTSQGKSIGSSLLTAKNRELDSLRMPAYLETFNPATVRLYQRFGFKILQEYLDNATGLSVFYMLRQPQ